jgi:Homeodomain-like domain
LGRGSEVITMEMFGKVRRMYYRDGLSRSEIARRTGLSRTTVKKWLRAPEGTVPRYMRQGRPGKLAPYEAYLLQALESVSTLPWIRILAGPVNGDLRTPRSCGDWVCGPA